MATAKAKAKRKTLPKDLEALLEEGDFAKITAALEGCDPDARGGIGKRTALAFAACSDELTRWLVARGATVDAVDTWGNTPLQSRVSERGAIDVLLELGANVHHAGASIGTALHTAADANNEAHVTRLLDAGAKVNAPNRAGKTALEITLERAHNARLPSVARIARLLLDAGAEKRPSMQAAVKRIGETFEFHRAGFPEPLLSESIPALDALYTLFDVPPVARREVHDGTSPIVVPAGTWGRQHAALWAMLVPSSGAAKTVQGEVIRIAGRIADEIKRNGGANWDDAYRAMAKAYLEHVQSGTALPAADIATLRTALRARPSDDDVAVLAQLAVRWVESNPKPVPLAPPSYTR